MGVSAALLERIEALWASPALGTWVMLAAATVIALVLFVIVLKADRSLANGALAIITLLALGVASAALMRDRTPALAPAAVLPAAAPVGQGALACLDGLAGERVESACEKALFASADATAAAVSYTAAQISRLPAAAAQSSPELGQLRRVLERDRYGLVAQVLTTREGCTPQACETFRHLGDTSHVAANMTGGAFEALVSRHAEAWEDDAPQVAAAPGKPSSIEFPTSASIPAVSIMTPPDQRGSAAEPPPLATAPQPPLPGSIAYPPASLPQQSIPLQAPSQAAAPPAAPPPASAAAANAPVAPPARRAAPQARRAPPPAPPPVQLVPPAD